ncbi:hypothetical protein L6164_009541 [Bauhinia variegata]|uniref:Uncharacterized protein n=1 Tax=Bauhinia variegata TaxID=167791 RepID=A0ACB9PLE4_BAUVA|nr:hypothetical protein L6164_009541 [Bauhinia variegata]
MVRGHLVDGLFLRTPLQELCLQIKSLQLGTIGSFLAKALQPPDPLAVQNAAIELLKTIGALDEKEELTPPGCHLCTIPLDPNIGKMLLMGSIFQCLNPALTIAAALTYRDPFVLPINRKDEADAAKRSFAGDSCRLTTSALKIWRWFVQFLELVAIPMLYKRQELIKKLHGELDKLLDRKIQEPGFDISAEGEGVVAAAVELLHSQNVL